jgi:hypothetical protein
MENMASNAMMIWAAMLDSRNVLKIFIHYFVMWSLAKAASAEFGKSFTI